MKAFKVDQWLMGAVALLVFIAMRATAQSASDGIEVFNPAGALVASVYADDANESAGAVYSIKTPDLANPNPPGPTVLIEPGGNLQTGPFSDIFGIPGGQIPFLSFSSDEDPLGSPFGTSGVTFLVEDQEFYDMTQYLNPNLASEGWTARFFSDRETTVPDTGSTALLLSITVAGLALFRRKAS